MANRDRKLLDEAWRGFARAVIPADASAVQRQEMRRAFYGGAYAAWRLYTGIGACSVSEEQGVAILESLHRECREFLQLVKAGRV